MYKYSSHAHILKLEHMGNSVLEVLEKYMCFRKKNGDTLKQLFKGVRGNWFANITQIL